MSGSRCVMTCLTWMKYLQTWCSWPREGGEEGRHQSKTQECYYDSVQWNTNGSYLSLILSVTSWPLYLHTVLIALFREAILGAAASGALSHSPAPNTGQRHGLNNPPAPQGSWAPPAPQGPKAPTAPQCSKVPPTSQCSKVPSVPKGTMAPLVPQCPKAPLGVKEADRGNVRRRSYSGSQPEKPKETIWQFFVEGNKKGTCRWVQSMSIVTAW